MNKGGTALDADPHLDQAHARSLRGGRGKSAEAQRSGVSAQGAAGAPQINNRMA